MGCCKGENKERTTPEGIEPCCSLKGKRCFCLPYDDPLLIAAQALAIVALCVSWIWYVTLVISIAGITLLNILWCVRMPSKPLYIHVVVAAVASLVSLVCAIWIFIKWRSPWVYWCVPLIMYADDNTVDDWDFQYDDDWSECHREAWGAIAVVCSALWAASAICMFCFVKSGRHAKWEAKYVAEAEAEAAAENDGPMAASAEEEVPPPEAVPSTEQGDDSVVEADAAVVVSEPPTKEVDDV